MAGLDELERRRRGSATAAEDDILAVVRDIAGTVTLAGRSRAGECVGPYRVLASGVLDPSLVGFMARVSRVLADAGVPIMVYSSFERDYILVPSNHLEDAVRALESAGFKVTEGCWGEKKRGWPKEA